MPGSPGYVVGAGLSQLYSSSQPAAVPAANPYWDDDSMYNPSAYVGVPQGYRALTGFSQPNYGAHVRAGSIPAPVPEYAKPIYTQNDLANAAQLPPDQMLALQMRLSRLTGLDPDFPGFFDESTHDALESVMGIANQRGWTIDQVENYMKENKASLQDMGWSSSSSSGGAATPDYSPYTTTTSATQVSTTENIALTGRGGARALLEQALATELGREPTRKETSRFLRSLNRAERNHPSTTKSTTKSTTTTTTDPSPSGDTTVTSDTDTNTENVSRQSKVDPAQRAEGWAEKHGGKEAQAFQAGKFMDVLSSLIGL